MGFSILGIITVQWIWMNQAVKVKNELFNRSVIDAMQFTLAKLEKIRDVNVVTRISLGDSMLAPSPPTVPSPATISWKNESGKESNIHLTFSSNKNGAFTINAVSKTRDTLINRSENYSFFVLEDKRNIDSLLNCGSGKIDSLVLDFSKGKLNLPEIDKKLASKVMRLKSAASNVVTEIITSEKALPEMDIIKKILTKKLEEKNIPIAFQLGIFRDSMLTNKTEMADSTRLVHSMFKAKMFSNDILERNLILSVYFPSKDQYIYKTIGWLLAFSLILSLLILFSFSAGIIFLLRQKKISEMKSDFINNMTHEFKTPIATIAVASDSVLNEKVIGEPERIRYFMGMIKKENSRMNRQVEDILTIARLDKKDFEFNWELVDVHEMIEEAIGCIRLQIDNKGGQISLHLTATNPIVTCDRTHCANVLYNLLDNAIKYSNEAPEILVETRNANNGLLISVQDNGIGMSKATQSKIFEKFYRQSTGNIHNIKGFGLGLSYVKAIIEANNGRIQVKSELGKGSRFEVFVPFIRE